MTTMSLTDGADLEDFARRIKQALSGPAYRRLGDELRMEPDRGLAALTALSEHSSQVVRVWAGGVARKEFGRDAVPLLLAMATNRFAETRDFAMQDLEAIDPELLRPFIPEMRRTFRRSKDLYGPGGAAMWRLVRLGDRESAALFREFAAKRDAGRYDHRMPLLLADYLEDPTSLVRRIRAHHHAWLLWLAKAVASLDPPGGEAALRAGADDLPDEECREICRTELIALQWVCEQPPGADYESDD